MRVWQCVKAKEGTTYAGQAGSVKEVNPETHPDEVVVKFDDTDKEPGALASVKIADLEILSF